MSLATLGAVSAATNELPLPDTSSLSLGEALILSGGGGTTEAVVIRSIASGRNIGVTVNRGALGTLRLAHTAPTTVSAYDPSGSVGGGGVTVDNGTDPPAAVTTLVTPGAMINAGSADLSGVLQFRLLGPFTLTPASSNVNNPDDNGALVTTVPAGSLVRVVAFNRIAWDATAPVLFVVLAPGVAAASSNLLGTSDAAQITNGTAGGAVGEAISIGTIISFGVADVECGIYAAIYTDSGTPSVGQTDIYAYIVTPS